MEALEQWLAGHTRAYQINGYPGGTVEVVLLRSDGASAGLRVTARATGEGGLCRAVQHALTRWAAGNFDLPTPPEAGAQADCSTARTCPECGHAVHLPAACKRSYCGCPE